MMGMAPAVVLYTLQYIKDYLQKHDPQLVPAFTKHLPQIGAFISKQDFTGPLE